MYIALTHTHTRTHIHVSEVCIALEIFIIYFPITSYVSVSLLMTETTLMPRVVMVNLKQRNATRQ